MKKTKFNPQLLNEELKRFRLLNEYSFYTEKETSDYEKPLILGTDLEEADEDPNATDPNQDAAAGGDVNDMGGEDGLSDETPANANPEAPADDMGGETPAEPGTEEPTEDDLDFGVGAEDPAAEEIPADPAIEEPADDSVEIDVSQIVKGTEEAKEAAEFIMEYDYADFDTAWSPPINAIEALSKMFPEVDLTLSYYEPGMCFYGTANFYDGMTSDDCHNVEDKEKYAAFLVEEFGYDEEDAQYQAGLNDDDEEE
jgi:hypothetical protein